MAQCAVCENDATDSVEAIQALYAGEDLVSITARKPIDLCRGHFEKAENRDLNFDWCSSCADWRTAGLTCWACEAPLANSKS